MTIPTDIREKLSKLVTSAPIEDAAKQRWTEALKSENPPPDVIYEIVKSLDEIRDHEEKFSADMKDIDGFFDGHIQRLESSGDEIGNNIKDLEGQTKNFENEIENLSKEVKELEQEFEAKEEAHPSPATDKAEPPVTNHDLSGTAQAQHLRTHIQDEIQDSRFKIQEEKTAEDKIQNNTPQASTQAKPTTAPVSVDDYYK